MGQASGLPLALTMGEPAGIGGEIALKAWCGRARTGVPPFFVIDDLSRLSRLAARLELDVPMREIGDAEATLDIFPAALPVLPIELATAYEPGLPDIANAPAVIAAITRGVELVTEGHADALVTNPIHKETLNRSGFAHAGHTEFLGALSGNGARPVMMIACPGLRVVPVTVHVALARALADLTEAAIVECGRIVARALRTDFGIAEPRLAVAALNPHAGEGGMLGREEVEVIAPAIACLEREGLRVAGPTAADSLFHVEARRGYDAVLCMYHDQALIPLKTLDFVHGVNITLGLPFVRTSPDHGTALDIAGTGKASEASLVAAMATASALARRRAAGADARS